MQLLKAARALAVLQAVSTAVGCVTPPDVPPDPPGASAKASASVTAAPIEEIPEPASLYQESDSAPIALRPRIARTVRCNGEVCVRGEALDDPTFDATLAVASRALRGLVALGLTSLPSDGVAGGDGRLDIYLDTTRDRPAAFVDPGSIANGFDQGTAYVVAPLTRDDCPSQQRLAGAVAATILLHHDSALEPNSLSMLSDYLATVIEPCTIAELEAIDTTQRSPERTFTGSLGEVGPGSFLFPWFLEDRYGTRDPGRLTMALAGIASQHTKAGPMLDEPDVFDALRVTQHGNGLSLADTLLGFAVDRAFIGSRSDETHLVDVAKYGELGRVRIEWAIDATTLPRRLRPLRPIAPLGMTYFWLDFSKPGAPNEFTFAAEWEQPVVFRWAIVRVDAQGSELGRQELAPVLGNTTLQVDVRDVHGAAGVLVVGVNEGEERRDEPFDPGRPREPAHSYAVTFYP
ncbi:MAG: hypothetical protein U0271_40485 [Polyangiaceae bacterium]